MDDEAPAFREDVLAIGEVEIPFAAPTDTGAIGAPIPAVLAEVLPLLADGQAPGHLSAEMLPDGVCCDLTRAFEDRLAAMVAAGELDTVPADLGNADDLEWLRLVCAVVGRGLTPEDPDASMGPVWRRFLWRVRDAIRRGRPAPLIRLAFTRSGPPLPCGDFVAATAGLFAVLARSYGRTTSYLLPLHGGWPGKPYLHGWSCLVPVAGGPLRVFDTWYAAHALANGADRIWGEFLDATELPNRSSLAATVLDGYSTWTEWRAYPEAFRALFAALLAPDPTGLLAALAERRVFPRAVWSQVRGVLAGRGIRLDGDTGPLVANPFVSAQAQLDLLAPAL